MEQDQLRILASYPSAYERMQYDCWVNVGIGHDSGKRQYIVAMQEEIQETATTSFSSVYIDVCLVKHLADSRLPDPQRALFQMRDVITCFPWLNHNTQNYRLSKGFTVASVYPQGKGTAALFTFPQLIHLAVIDELASLGALIDIDRLVVERAT
jgi:hypothetical protein